MRESSHDFAIFSENLGSIIPSVPSCARNRELRNPLPSAAERSLLRHPRFTCSLRVRPRFDRPGFAARTFLSRQQTIGGPGRSISTFEIISALCVLRTTIVRFLRLLRRYWQVPYHFSFGIWHWFLVIRGLSTSASC